MYKHLVIIDALNLIRRIHAVQSHQHAHDAVRLQATTQAISNAAQRLIHQLKPSHIIAVFDSPHVQSWRKRYHSEYKAKRAPLPQDIQAQWYQLQDALLELGIESAEAGEHEADDLCATLALKACRGGFNASIVSTDQGYYSLLSANLKQYDYFQRRYIEIHEIEKKYQLRCAQLPDFWALVGNTSDGVSGVPGIGKKTATTLLQQYQSCQNILAMADSEDKAVVKIQHHHEAFARAKRLLGLNTQLELGFNLKNLRLAPTHHA